MATVDLGKVSFTQKGTYDGSTAYAVKDVVQYTDQNETSSFVKINSTATGQAPQTNGTVNTSHWAIFAKGSSLATANLATYDGSTTYKKGDIVQYTDTGVISTYLYINNTPASGLTPSSGGTVDASHWQYVAKGTASVAVSWQSTAKTANFSASAAEGYFVDTNGGEVTVTTPSSPNAGDEFIIVDLRGKFGVNKCNIVPAGSDKIKGSTTTHVINEAYASTRMVFSGATYGWVPVSSAATDAKPVITQYTATYLVVGGGGGGGCDSNDAPQNNSSGGGGGAGGFRTGTVQFNSSVAYTCTVGSGGAGGGVNETAPNGTASSLAGSNITTISSAGGGGGGGETKNGAAGGSGGGGGYGNDGPAGTGGAGNTPSTSPSQGNNGGNANSSNYAGGGGGAGEAGNTDQNGAGGDGTQSSITGAATYYAGGGAAGKQGSQPDNPAGDGGGAGPGDGGAGSNKTATANTGGGGCGSGNQGSIGKTGGTGGTGVVILSVPTASYSGTVSGGPTVTTSGSNTIIKFTGTGTYTG